jgi:TatD DNase family protein
VDTHAHLEDSRFDRDREGVLDRALEADVRSIVTIGVDLSTSRAAVALAERYPGIYAAVGVQPNVADQTPWPHQALCGETAGVDDTCAALQELLSHPRVVAIGEIGLDYYWDRCPREIQQAAFEAQLALAAQFSKPVVVHIRDKRDQSDAYHDALGILRPWVCGRSAQRAPGVLHCFSGTAEVASSALGLGFYLGVDGPVTYPNASARPLQAMVADLPLERLLLETDCPYLAPQAYRGRRNEPAYLPFIGAKVAELKGIDAPDVAQATTANARLLFHLGSGA